MDRSELQVAVDVGARRHRVAVGDATGRLIEEFDLEHTATGLNGFFNCIERFAAKRKVSVTVRQSMSRKADCWDNAPIESFFHTLKTELVMHCGNQTRDEARSSLFEYMEVFYHRQRRYSTIHYETPLAFEALTNP